MLSIFEASYVNLGQFLCCQLYYMNQLYAIIDSDIVKKMSRLHALIGSKEPNLLHLNGKLCVDSKLKN